MLKKIILGLLIIALLILVFSYKNLRNADINTLKIKSLKKINKTILQISDFHSSKFIDLKDLEKTKGQENRLCCPNWRYL